MNVDGMTRENVASHLQKYRLYLKRQAGSSDAIAAQIAQRSLVGGGPSPTIAQGLPLLPPLPASTVPGKLFEFPEKHLLIRSNGRWGITVSCSPYSLRH